MLRFLGVKLTPEDQRILARLKKKTGGNATSVIRYALRVLDAKEAATA